MSPRRKSKGARKKRKVVRSKDMVVRVVHSDLKTPPDYEKLARALLLTAKEMQRERDAKQDQ
jgi:hypothetical protein